MDVPSSYVTSNHDFFVDKRFNKKTVWIGRKVNLTGFKFLYLPQRGKTMKTFRWEDWLQVPHFSMILSIPRDTLESSVCRETTTW